MKKISGIGLAGGAVFFAAAAHAALNFAGCGETRSWKSCFDDNLSQFKNYSESKDGGVLAWGESYRLHAFLDMYEAFRETRYLDLFTNEADSLFRENQESPLDPDGDGYWGWPAPKYGVNILKNRLFNIYDGDAAALPFPSNGDGEQPSSSDPTLPLNWTRLYASSGTAYRSALPEEAHGGKGSFVTLYDTTNHLLVSETWRGYVPNARYELSFWGRVQDDDPDKTPFSGRVSIGTGTANGEICKFFFNDKEWARHSFSFFAPDSPTAGIRIRCYSNRNKPSVGSAKAFYNDFVLRPTPRIADWTFGPGTVPENIRVSSAAADRTTADGAGIVIAPASVPQSYDQFMNNFLVQSPVKSFYQITVDARAEGGAGARVEVLVDGTVQVSTECRTAGWSSMKLTVPAPSAANTPLGLRLTHTGDSPAGSLVHFSNPLVQSIQEYTAHDGMILYPLAKYIRLVDRDTSLPDAYKQKSVLYKSALAHFLGKWERYYKSVGQEGYILFPNDQNGSDSNYNLDIGYGAGATLPYNQFLVYARFLLELSRTTGDPQQNEMAKAMGRAFRNRLYENPQRPSAWAWNYSDEILLPPDLGRRVVVEDVSHANLDVSMMLDLNRLLPDSAPPVFSWGDIQKLKSTFFDVMWNKNMDAPTIGDSVDSSGTAKGNGRLLSQWVNLAEFDPRVLSIVKKIGPDNILTLAGLAVQEAAGVGNPGFEDYFDEASKGIPLGWSRWDGAASRSEAPGDFHSGRAGLRIDSNAGEPSPKWHVLEQRWCRYVPGTVYQLSFWGKVDSTDTLHGRLEISTLNPDGSAGQRIAQAFSSGSDWARYAVTFSTGAVVPGLMIRCYYDGFKPGSVFFDDLQISTTARPSSPPRAPGTPSAVPEQGAIRLSWPPSTESIDGFMVSVSTRSDFSSLVPGWDGRNVGLRTSVVVPSLSQNTSYYIRVQAFNNLGGVSPFSEPAMGTTPLDTTPPAAPADLVGAGRDRTIRWSWKTPADIGGSGISGYRMDISTDGAFGSFLPGWKDRSVGLVTSSAAASLALDTTYYARLRAVDGAGNVSVPSGAASANTGGFSDDFNGESGLLPSRWEIVQGSASTVSIVNDVFYGGSGKSAYLADDSSQTISQMQISAGRPMSQFYFSGYFRFREVTGSHFVLCGSGNSQLIYFVNAAYASGGGVWRYYDGNQYHRFSGDTKGFAAGTWYKIEVEGDFIRKTFSVWVDGVAVGENIPIPGGNASITAISLLPASSSGTGGMWVDGIWFGSAKPIPDPTTSSALSKPDGQGLFSGPKDFSETRVYPNPFRPGRGAAGIRFDHLPVGSTVKIHTIQGLPLRTLSADNDQSVLWDMTNDNGRLVASGVYVAELEKDGIKKRIKIVVER